MSTKKSEISVVTPSIPEELKGKIEDITTEKPAETKESVETPKIIAKSVKKEDELVEVNINANVNVYIGNKYWYFKKGQMKVPAHIKRELYNRGLLNAI